MDSKPDFFMHLTICLSLDDPLECSRQLVQLGRLIAEGALSTGDRPLNDLHGRKVGHIGVFARLPRPDLDAHVETLETVALPDLERALEENLIWPDHLRAVRDAVAALKQALL